MLLIRALRGLDRPARGAHPEGSGQPGAHCLHAGRPETQPEGID